MRQTFVFAEFYCAFSVLILFAQFFTACKPDETQNPSTPEKPITRDTDSRPLEETVKLLKIRGFSQKFYKKDEVANMRRNVMQLARQHPQRIYINGQTNQPKVALSFDDGPHPDYTPQILSVLKSYNIRATFFCIGKNVERFPHLVRQMHNDGHWVLNHSYSHKKFTEIDSLSLVSEIRKTNDAIFKQTGLRPRWLRPPYGAVDSSVFACLDAENMGVIYWSLDSYDWLESPGFVLNCIRDSVRNDEIILLHERRSTAKILPQIIENLQNSGYLPVRLDSLLDISENVLRSKK